jgi:GntR family transcriptional repressor for pyruvate dehydrogenase complex
MTATAVTKHGDGPPVSARTPKVSELVAREILRDLVARKVPPGSRLPGEQEMIKSLAVGRGSLREALRILEVQGVITMKPGPGGGPVLNEVSSRHFGSMSTLYFMTSGATYREVIEARVSMNPMLSRMAAQRGGRAPAARLQALVDETLANMGVSDREWLAITSRFYPTVGILSGNPILAMYATSLQDIYFEHLPPLAREPEAREDIVASHAAIARAVGRRDPEAAEQLARSAMLSFVSLLEQAFPAFLAQAVDWR